MSTPPPRPARDLPAAPHPPTPVHHGGLFGRLLAPLFDQVTVEPDTAERLQRAYGKGHVVHVLRSRRVLDPVFILNVLGRLGLPKPFWMHDHYASHGEPNADHMLAAVRAGEPVLLFLRRPRTLINPTGTYSEGHVEALLGLQRHLDRPLVIVPETLLLGRRAAGIRRSLVDVLFGDREAPGRLREMVAFLAHRHDARFHVGEPINVAAFLKREKGKTHAVVARKIRWAVLSHLAREEAIRTGPGPRSSARTRHKVLKDPAVQQHLEHRADAGETPEALEAKADQIVRRMAADIRPGWVRMLDALLDRIWRDIYDGIVVDRKGLETVWAAARRGPIVLVPSHKSHIDYLVLSQVFYKDGMMPPHIAAGDNLALPLVGTVLRRSGAFFIRRSMAGDTLYRLLLTAYVRRLLKEGHAVEFFIEGGRSRTGKQRAPKMGLLAMCVNPVLDRAVSDVTFVPVSIGYEKIIEARAYARELGGGKKRKEDLSALVSARRVLRSRYGRVYVDFDEPVSLRAFAAARGFDLSQTDQDDVQARRALITQLGHRIGYGIDRVTRLTPSGVAALILLAHARRGTAESELHRRAERLMNFATDIGARLSTSLAPSTRRDALREALGRLAGDGSVQMTPSPDGETIYRLDDAGRQALDYYKNNTLHFFAPYAIVALAIIGQDTLPASDQAVRETALELSRLLRLEFTFKGAVFDSNFDASIAFLQKRRIVERQTSDDVGAWGLTHKGRDAAHELAGMIAVFVEAYRLVAESIDALDEPVADASDLQRTIMHRAQRQVLEGRIRRAEAASLSTLDNAIERFVDEGVITRTEAGRVERQDEGRQALRDLITLADRLLARLD